jgi:hypothetical protein
MASGLQPRIVAMKIHSSHFHLRGHGEGGSRVPQLIVFDRSSSPNIVWVLCALLLCVRFQT